MIRDDVHKIVERVIEAHGGADRWKALEAIEAKISVRGFLFKTKQRPTHCKKQIFCFDRDYLLRRLDYTADDTYNL